MEMIRKEFIKEILETLKIPVGAFNVGTVADEIKHIPDTDLRAFHKALFGTSHSYLNGMDRIIKVAEQFKSVHIDETEAKAKELIDLVCGMHGTIEREHSRTSIDFDTLLKTSSHPTVSAEDISILNNVVYPDSGIGRSYKGLIANINLYSTGLEQLKAFVNAVEYSKSYSGAIECSRVKKMIGS